MQRTRGFSLRLDLPQGGTRSDRLSLQVMVDPNPPRTNKAFATRRETQRIKAPY
jgi:hypothetical protein